MISESLNWYDFSSIINCRSGPWSIKKTEHTFFFFWQNSILTTKTNMIGYLVRFLELGSRKCQFINEKEYPTSDTLLIFLSWNTSFYEGSTIILYSNTDHYLVSLRAHTPEQIWIVVLESTCNRVSSCNSLRLERMSSHRIHDAPVLIGDTLNKKWLRHEMNQFLGPDKVGIVESRWFVWYTETQTWSNDWWQRKCEAIRQICLSSAIDQVRSRSTHCHTRTTRGYECQTTLWDF